MFEKICNIQSRSYIGSPDLSTYIGMASNTFKERFTNYSASFRNSKYKESTNLSQRIWELKNNNKNFDIKWSIVASASSYNNC